MSEHVLFRCPECHGSLISSLQDLTCHPCGQSYPIINKVPRFAPTDEFYEGKVCHTNRFRQSKNPIVNAFIGLDRTTSISGTRERFLLAAIPDGGRILDLGCGGGTELLALKGCVTGLDISVSSVEAARSLYDDCAQGDLLKLPFANEFFDAVVAQDVFGHIPREDKDAALAEMVRVLKPDGRLALVIEGVGTSLLWRFAQKHPELWQRYFVEQDGHFGLEYPTQILARFERLPLKRIFLWRKSSFFWSLEDFLARFKNEYRTKSVALKLFIHFCKIMSRTRFTSVLFDWAMGMLSRTIDPLLPMNCTAALFLCCEKTNHEAHEG